MHLDIFQKRVKTIGFIVFLMLVLVGAIVGGQKIPGMLSRASSCPATGVTAQQVTANSAIVAWQSDDPTQGRVEYGTAATNLTMSAPETAATASHAVPLTLLIPDTMYYYLIKVGDATCDSSGQACGDSCVPWSFTTGEIPKQKEAVVSIVPGKSANGSGVSEPEPTSSLSAFCAKVKARLGGSSKDATGWAADKQYDIDNNGIINGKDVIKCAQSGE